MQKTYMQKFTNVVSLYEVFLLKSSTNTLLPFFITVNSFSDNLVFDTDYYLMKKLLFEFFQHLPKKCNNAL